MILNRPILALILSIVFQKITVTNSELCQNEVFSIGGILKKFGSLIVSPFHQIYPGTLWCGAGSIARSYEDLGLFENTDRCCREHDNCPLVLSPGERMLNIYNDGSYTRSHCDCDLTFYNCLKSVSTIVSFKIGKKYFNLLAPPCFTYDHPIKKCLIYHGIFRKKCIKYEVDESAPLTWQWRDNRLY